MDVGKEVKFLGYAENGDVSNVGGQLAEFMSPNAIWKARINCRMDVKTCPYVIGTKSRYCRAVPGAACGKHPDAEEYLKLIPA